MKIKSIFTCNTFISTFDINPLEKKVIYADNKGVYASSAGIKRRINLLDGDSYRSIRMCKIGYYVVGTNPGSITRVSVDPLLTQSIEEKLFSDNKDLLEGILDLVRDSRDNWYIFRNSTVCKVERKRKDHIILVGEKNEVGSKDGDGLSARLNRPTCAVNIDDFLYFCEGDGSKIRVVDVRFNNEVSVWSMNLIETVGICDIECKRQFRRVSPYSGRSLVAADAFGVYIVYLDTNSVRMIHEFKRNYITDVKVGYDKRIYISTITLENNKSNIWRLNSGWTITRLIWIGWMKEENNEKFSINTLPRELVHMIISFVHS